MNPKYVKIIFTLVGVWMLCKSWNMISVGRESQSWPVSKGEVIASQIKHDHRLGRRARNYFRVLANYRYEVSGVQYTGADLSYGSTPSAFRSVEEAESLLARLSKGTKVDVYYNPKQPVKSVLYPGGSSVDYVLFLIGVVFLLAPRFRWGNSIAGLKSSPTSRS